MKTVYKYPLEMTRYQTLELPVGARLLHVACQNEQPFLWALVDTDEPLLSPVIIHMYGTGHSVIEAELDYIGTYMQLQGQFVWHVFKENR